MQLDHYHTATLDKESIKALQDLEKELNVDLVAFEADPEIAQLTGQQLDQIRAFEEKTGKVLIAYKH